jgi:glucokinase
MTAACHTDAMSHVVGLDVGGTKIAAGVLDPEGRVIARSLAPTPANDPAALRSAIVDSVEKLRRDHEVDAVGISAAGFVRVDRRGVMFGPNLDWGSEPIGDAVADAIGLPVVVENDGNAAAWAEHRFGAGQGVADQLMVVLGTGVGGGLILGGRVYRGGHGLAAEIGHLGLVPDGIPCPCGRRGCLEQYASGKALERDARAMAAEGKAPALLEAAQGDADAVTGRMVTRLAEAGDAASVRLVQELAEALAAGIASIDALLHQPLVVIGGGLGSAGEVVLAPLRTALAAAVGDAHRGVPEVRGAQLGNDAGLIGAADLARHAPVAR